MKRTDIGLHLFFCLMWLIPTADAGNRDKVALVMKALSNPFFAEMKIGAQTYARDHKVPLEVYGMERETDIDDQIGIIQSLIARNYGAIVLDPADSKKLVPVCRQALKKGIVVINIDDPLDSHALAEARISIPFVGSDNRQGAALVGDYLRKKIRNEGRVLIIEGIPGVHNNELRKAGFIEALTRNTKIQIVACESANWHENEAFALTMKLLLRDSDIDAVFCTNDSMALGAVKALDLLDRTGKVLVAGYDNIEAVRNEMRQGHILATVEQHPKLLGRIGVELAAQALTGKEIPDHLSVDVDLVTSECFSKTVAMSLPDLQAPFYQALVQKGRETAELFGLTLIVADAENDHARQLTDLKKFVDAQVDAVIVSPTGSEIVTPGIELINAAGIPVLTVNHKASAGKIACHITTDNTAGGNMIGEFIARRLNGRGSILEIEGPPDNSACFERSKGFDTVLHQYPNLRVTAREVGFFDRKKGRASMKKLLDRGQTFDAVFAHNDAMILGVLDALETAGVTKRPLLVGFDAIPPALDAIRQGKLDATVAHSPEEMGRLAVQNAVKLLRGETVPSTLWVKLELIKE